jgi:ABC-2 type transport system permease protein
MRAVTEPSRSGQRRSAVGLLTHQIRYEQLSFWRNPQSAFFTFMFPVLIVVPSGRSSMTAGRARSTTA